MTYLPQCFQHAIECCTYFITICAALLLQTQHVFTKCYRLIINTYKPFYITTKLLFSVFGQHLQWIQCRDYYLSFSLLSLK